LICGSSFFSPSEVPPLGHMQTQEAAGSDPTTHKAVFLSSTVPAVRETAFSLEQCLAAYDKTSDIRGPQPVPTWRLQSRCQHVQVQEILFMRVSVSTGQGLHHLFNCIPHSLGGGSNSIFVGNINCPQTTFQDLFY